MIDDDKIRKELVSFIGKKNLKMLAKFYKEHKLLFPPIVEDGVIIYTRLVYGDPISNHINAIFHIYPDIIKDWKEFDDYIYYTLIDILYEKKYLKEKC